MAGAGEGRAAFNIYYLTPKSKVYLRPEEYGIAMMAVEKLPFRFFHPFRHLTGNISEPMADKLIQLYDDLIGKKKPATA
jgi:hypothetical protein